MNEFNEHLNKADNFYNQGYAYCCSEPQRLTEAIHLLKKAASMYSELGNTDGQVKAHKYLGDTYGKLGDNKNALSCYRQVSKMENKCSPKSYELLCALNLIAMHYWDINDYKKALSYAMRSLAVQKRCDPLGKHEDTGMMFGVLGKMHSEIGNFTEALEFLLNGVSILERLACRPSELGYMHQNLAEIYRELGDFDKAIIHYDKALEHGVADGT